MVVAESNEFMAGVQFERQTEQSKMNRIYRSNLTGMVTKQDLLVPFSELAMYTGIAGGEIQAIGVSSSGKDACVTVKAKDGKTKVTCALAGEVLSVGIRGVLARFPQFKQLGKGETGLEM